MIRCSLYTTGVGLNNSPQGNVSVFDVWVFCFLSSSKSSKLSVQGNPTTDSHSYLGVICVHLFFAQPAQRPPLSYRITAFFTSDLPHITLPCFSFNFIYTVQISHHTTLDTSPIQNNRKNFSQIFRLASVATTIPIHINRKHHPPILLCCSGRF